MGLIAASKRRFSSTVAFLLLSLLLGSWVGSARSSGAAEGIEPSTALPADPVPGIPIDPATLVRTTDTSLYSPASPDPSGITYLANVGQLLISDSEVNEIPGLFTGHNLFQIGLDGSLLDTLTTIPFSDEPTGVAYNPTNNHLYISDDVGDRGFYTLDPGADGLYATLDDIIALAATAGFGATDVEDIAYDPLSGHVFIVDGAEAEVFEVAPGDNGIFDGGPPYGDDLLVNQFDVAAFGQLDPQGLAVNPVTRHLYILSSVQPLIAETLPDGTLLRYINISVAGARTPAGLAYAPASADPTARHFYLVDRGVDNNTRPDENDGKLYELTIPGESIHRSLLPVVFRSRAEE